MLALQIALGVAAGIILAYFVIQHQQSVGKAVASIAAFAGCAVLVGLLVIAVPAGVSIGTEYYQIDWSAVATGATILVMLALHGAGVAGLIQLARLRFPKVKRSPPNQQAEASTVIYWMLLAFANAMLIILVTWPVLAFTPVGEWWSATDAWSRSTEFKDGFGLLSNAILAPWPWAVVWIINRSRRTADSDEFSSDQALVRADSPESARNPR